MARRHKAFACQPQLSAPTQNVRGEYGPQALGDHQQKFLGHRLELSVSEHHCAAIGGVGRDELIGKPNAPAKVDSPGRVGDETIGTGFDQKTVFVNGAQYAAKTIARFEYDDFGGWHEFRYAMCRRQADNSAADNGYSFRNCSRLVHSYQYRVLPSKSGTMTLANRITLAAFRQKRRTR